MKYADNATWSNDYSVMDMGQRVLHMPINLPPPKPTMAEYLARLELALDYMADWRLQMGRDGMCSWHGDYIGWLRTAFHAAQITRTSSRCPRRDKTPLPLP